MIIADMLKKIKPSPTFVVVKKTLEMQNAGIDVLALGAGEPDFDTPIHIKNAAIDAINSGFTKYTAVDGIKDLKKAIINKFQRENDLSYNYDEVIVSVGGKQVIFNALVATMNAGDEVIIPIPYWVSYPDMVKITGGTPVFVSPSIDGSFKVNALDIEKCITDKTKWIILNSPSNPSGAAYTKEELAEIASMLLRYPHVNIISDDIYEHVTFDDFKFSNIIQAEPLLKNRTLIVNGVSKSYSMTGWRIGYGAGSPDLIKAMGIVQSQSTSNPCSISQKAAVAALDGDQSYIKMSNKIFQKRRDMTVDLLNKIKNVECDVPLGAFYLFPSCKKIIGKKTNAGKILENSYDVAEYLLEEAHVAVISGAAFGMEGYFRISYATSEEILQKACERISNAFNKLS